MNEVKTFADLFKPLMADMPKLGHQTVSVSIGEKAVALMAPTMATEDVAGSIERAAGMGKFLMAVESAQAELGRLNGISYSVALKHREVIGMEVTPDNFSTHVSKKNYDMATENLKMFAVIGLSAIIVAGFGFVIYKLLSASKKKTAGAKEIVKLNKEVEKAAKLFSSIDLSDLPPDAREKLFLSLQNRLNPLVKNSINADNFIDQGYAICVASTAYAADITQLEAYRFGAGKESWLIEPYLPTAEELTEAVKEMIALLGTVSAEGRDAVVLQAEALSRKMGECESRLYGTLGNWAKSNGAPTDAHGDTYVQEVIDASNQSTRLTPDLLIKRIEMETQVPDGALYDKYNKLQDEIVKQGKRLEEALKNLPKDKIDEDAYDFLSVVVENFKSFISDMDDLAWIVRSEAESLGNIYGYRNKAARDYAEAINSVLADMEDKDLAKKIQEQIKKAAKELPSKRIALESLEDQIAGQPDLGSKVAVESIDWDNKGEHQDSGDGLDVVAREAEEFLSLPEYSQAGYRFDPRDGYDGANIMAMESWSQGTKLAIGIAAAVGLLGIGALIASSIMKRSSSSRESHATEGQIKQAAESWKKLSGETGSIMDELRDLAAAVNANKDYVASHPQWPDQYQSLKKLVDRSSSYSVEIDGQNVPVGKAIVDELGGDLAYSQAAKFGEFSKGRPPISSLDINDGRIARQLKDLYENVIETPIRALEIGRPAEGVLDDLNKYLESKGNMLRGRLVDGEYNTIEMQLAQVDGNWQPKGEYNLNSTEILTKPTEFLSMALGGHNMLLDLNERIGAALGEFAVDDRMLARFRKVEEQSKGSRDATASILRRIEEFKLPFANFVRVLRRDQENIEKLLQFVDRYVKAMGKYGKQVTGDLSEIRRQMKTIANDATPQ